MTRGVAALKDEIVDLLATWGATGVEGGATLFRVLAEHGQSDGVARSDLLRRALEAPEGSFDPGLRGELAEIDRALPPGNASVPGEITDRLERALDRLTTDLDQRVTAQRDRLTAELEPWWLLMAAEKRTAALESLWRIDPRGDPEVGLTALGELGRLREIADDARRSKRAEIRELLESGEEIVDPAVAEAARSAVENDDPAGLAEAGRSLRALTIGRERRRAEEQLGTIRPRVRELVEKGRRLAAERSAASDPAVRKILDACLASADAALERAAPDDEGAAAAADTLETWERSLGAILDGTGESNGSPGAAAVDALLAELAERREWAEGDDAAELGALEEEIRGAGSAPHAVMLGAAERLGALREQEGRRRAGPEKKLRETAKSLESALRESAPLLPTDRVLEARLMLERVEESIASSNADRIEELRASIAQATKGLKAQARELREERRGKGEAQRKRLLDQAARLENLATGRATTKIRTWIADLEAAEPEELGERGKELEELARPMENEVRLRAALALARTKEIEGGDTERLRKALDEDDLPAVAALTASMKAPGGVGAVLRGPIGWFAIPLLALVLSLGFVLGRPFWSNRPTDYRLTLADGATASGSQIELVGPNQTLARKADAGGSATFSLPPGSYEVYVNDRFTGREVRVPDDPKEIGEIPVPPEAAR